MGNITIVSRINTLLAEKGLSKQDFYKACNITSGAYSQWNTGKTFPKRKSLEKIANYLETSVEYLLGNTDQKEKTAQTGGQQEGTAFPISDQEQAILEMFRQVSQRGRLEIIAYIMNVVKEEQQKQQERGDAAPERTLRIAAYGGGVTEHTYTATDEEIRKALERDVENAALGYSTDDI